VADPSIVKEWARRGRAPAPTGEGLRSAAAEAARTRVADAIVCAASAPALGWRRAGAAAPLRALSLASRPITPAPDRRSHEGARMLELLGFISSLITLYIYIIIAGAVMSWLIAFNVINPYNQFVRSIWQALIALTEPLLRPIRRWMPDLGGIDISPVVLILLCAFVQSVVLPNIAKLLV
jgi:YggT family protein